MQPQGPAADAVTIDVPARPQLAGALLAAATLAVALLVTESAGVGYRDPDGVLGRRLPLLLAIIGTFLALDVVPRALRAANWQPRRLPGCIREVFRTRWSARRFGIAALAICSFYVTYLSYRNLKSVVPLVNDGPWDFRLLELERDIFFGHDPASLLHSVLGTGISAHLLSAVYLFYLAFVPITLGAAVILNTKLRLGLWYALALGFNWVLGAASYFLLPSLGPIYIEPQIFQALPETGTSALQQTLFASRVIFMADPDGSGGIQSIAAFASLHVSVVFTAALMAQMLQLHRLLRIGLWTFLGLTMIATIYFGWHYIVDDIAGLVIGGLAVLLSRLAIGPPDGAPRGGRWRRRGRAAAPEHAHAHAVALAPARESNLNLANAITGARMVLVAPFVLLLSAGATLPAAGIFLVCLASDALDGHVARSRTAVTRLGQLLDPLADKLLIGGALGVLVAEGRVHWAIALVIVAREVAVTGLRAAAATRGVIIPAGPLGKAKMAAQSVAILALVAAPTAMVPQLMLYAAAALTVVSGVDYAVRYRMAPRSAAPVGASAQV